MGTLWMGFMVCPVRDEPENPSPDRERVPGGVDVGVHSASGTQTRKKRIQGGLSGGSGGAASDGDQPDWRVRSAENPVPVNRTKTARDATNAVQQLVPNVLFNDMTRQQFEGGVQRLYYVAWAAFSLIYCTSVISDIGRNDFSSTEMGIAIGMILLFLIGPLVLMHLVRWVYRGFFPQ